MDNIDLIIKDMAQKSLFKSFKRNGIEGTEDKIKETYKNLPKIRKILLEEYNRIIKRK